MADPLHIAVVDDEIKTREMIGDYLTLHGMRVTLCDGGRSLRKLIASGAPDLVILDLNMPEEDGLSIVRELKTSGGVPVIMLTASASPIDRVVGLELGADDYIAKPCELRELLARVRTVLRRVPASGTTRTERRLAAIASFDVVGFSLLIQEDEPGTRAAIDAVLAETIGPGLERFRGTLFKMLGDGGLVEFSSLVNAVDWALTFQTAMGQPADALPSSRLRFRIGIAIGDIVVKNDDRFGEGIALAVRIQEKSRVGGVALSDYAFNLMRGKTSASFDNGGLQKLKHFEEETTIWHWAGTVEMP